jgi:hypothetical protein
VNLWFLILTLSRNENKHLYSIHHGEVDAKWWHLK